MHHPESPKDRNFAGHAKTSGPLVQVVTPFYNTADYLAECMESVLAQTYSHWEYLLVDNQSTDGSSEIARAYAEKDSRIRVIKTPEFFPQIPNFNYAMTQVNPDSVYCKIIMADDWLTSRCLEEMVKVAESNPRIGLVSSYRFIDQVVSGHGLDPKRNHFPGREIAKLQLHKKTVVFGSHSTFLIRTSVVMSRRPCFSVNTFQEDNEAAYEILRDWDFGFAHHVLSYTRREDTSTLGVVSRFNPHLRDFLITVEKYANDFLGEEEAAQCKRENRLEYYGYLARSALLGRWNSRFWKFHLQGLRNCRVSFHVPTLILASLLTFIDLLGNPKMALGRFLKIRRGHPLPGFVLLSFL